MHSLHHLFLLFSLGQACPYHQGRSYDPQVVEANIAAANSRKRAVTQKPFSKFAIKNVYVFDGYKLGDKLSTVVIDGSVIGSDSSGAKTVDGRGGILMPGLFDNHNHPSELDDLRNLSRYGVTTSIGMSCWGIPDRCASLRNQPGLTDFYSAGHQAMVFGSDHGNQVNAQPNETISNTSMIPSWVANEIAHGSDLIKLVTEVRPPTLSQEEHDTIVRTAHERGLNTATHANSLSGYQTATLSNTNFIQHTPTDGLLNASTIAQIVARHQHSTPTMHIYQHARMTSNLTEAQAAQLMKIVSTNVKNMYDAGIPILAGTDSASAATAPFHFPFGDSLHAELEALVSAGIPNLDVLKAATSRAARAYNMRDRGVIAPGLRADLVLVRGNPLKNISKTREIERVWIQGVQYGSYQ